ncbi:hypothetical protein Q8A73_013728 [Channa argus]|nr:hypothetical protein Q8A73_013728 [Channa argus]
MKIRGQASGKESEKTRVSPEWLLKIRISAMGLARAIMVAGCAPDGLSEAPRHFGSTTTNGEGSVLCKGLRKNKQGRAVFKSATSVPEARRLPNDWQAMPSITMPLPGQLPPHSQESVALITPCTH